MKKSKFYKSYPRKQVVHARRLAIVIISVICCLMIMLPTFIVKLPFGDPIEPTVESNPETEKTTEDTNEDSLEVTVQRANTEEEETVRLEEYVISVVASEMPADFADEALKAQAVAARTYIVNHLQQQGDDESVITDTTQHQVYKNEAELKEQWGDEFKWKFEKVSDAVLETQGEIITYDDSPITPTFFSMSNGYTEDAENYWGNEQPYLKSVESKWEESHPDFLDQTIFTVHELSEKLGVPLQAGTQVALSMSRTDSQRVAELTIDEATFSGKDIREKLSLRSNDFSIKQQNDHFIFTTKGYGHGVGMSQHGANGMAQAGHSYDEILHHYYQDVAIDPLQEAAPTLVSK